MQLSCIGLGGNNFCAHLGICNFMACGSSDAATTNDMTQLTSFEGDPSNVMSYGAVKVNDVKTGYLYFTNKTSVSTCEYRYVYTAPTTFTCKEFGTYTLVPNSTVTEISSNVNYEMDMTQLDAYMFSRVVLAEPIEMTAGETYFFDYTIRFSRNYATTYETTDDMFGLPTVLRRRFNTSEYNRSDVSVYVPYILNSKVRKADYSGSIGRK